MGTSPENLCDEFATSLCGTTVESWKSSTISFRPRRAVKFPDPRRGVDYPLSTLVAATYTSFSQIEDGVLNLPYYGITRPNHHLCTMLMSHHQLTLWQQTWSRCEFMSSAWQAEPIPLWDQLFASFCRVPPNPAHEWQFLLNRRRSFPHIVNRQQQPREVRRSLPCSACF